MTKDFWGIDLLAEFERQSATEPLIKALDGGYYNAIVGLGTLKVQRVVPKLVTLIGPDFVHDEDFTVLQWVVTAIGKIGDKRGVDFLLKQLAGTAKAKRDYREPTASVLIALRRIGDERAFEPLKTILDAVVNDYQFHEDLVVEALQACGGLKSTRPILESMQRFLERPPAPPMHNAGMGRMPTFLPTCVDALIKTYRVSIDSLIDETEGIEPSIAIKLSGFLTSVIAASHDPQKFEKLEPYLADPSHGLFYSAFIACCQRGDKRDLPRLFELLDSNPERHFFQSLRPLVKFGDDLVDLLLERLADPDAKPRLQCAILDLLVEIDSRRTQSAISALFRSKSVDESSAIGRLTMNVLGGDPNYIRDEVARKYLPDMLFGLTVKNGSVVYSALSAIVRLGEFQNPKIRDSVAALIPTMRSDQHLPSLVLYYLVQSRDDRAIPLLIHELEELHSKLNGSGNRFDRSGQLRTLVEIGSQAAFTALLAYGKRGAEESMDMRNALRFLTRDGLEPILSLLTQFDLETRLQILEHFRYAILGQDLKKAIAFLRANLNDKSFEIRLLSAEALASSCLVENLEPSERETISTDLDTFVQSIWWNDQPKVDGQALHGALKRLKVFGLHTPQLVAPLLMTRTNLEAAIALVK